MKKGHTQPARVGCVAPVAEGVSRVVVACARVVWMRNCVARSQEPRAPGELRQVREMGGSAEGVRARGAARPSVFLSCRFAGRRRCVASRRFVLRETRRRRSRSVWERALDIDHRSQSHEAPAPVSRIAIDFSELGRRVRRVIRARGAGSGSSTRRWRCATSS